VGGQPEAQQVAAAVGLGVVLEGLAAVQDLGIGQQLDVARFEVHRQVERRVVGDLLDQCDRLGLSWGETGHGGMSLGVTDVPGDEEHAWRAGDVVEHWEREVRILAGRLLAVAVPVQRLVEHFEEVGAPYQDLVVDGGGTGDAALAARARRAQAQKADDVRAVGVKVLAFTGLVQPDGRIASEDSLVADVAEEVAVCILADRRAQLEPEADVGHLHFVRGELFEREPANQDEALSAHERPRPAGHGVVERGEIEGRLRYLERGVARGDRFAGRTDQLGPLGRIKGDRPVAGVGDVGGLPHRS